VNVPRTSQLWIISSITTLTCKPRFEFKSIRIKIIPSLWIQRVSNSSYFKALKSLPSAIKSLAPILGYWKDEGIHRRALEGISNELTRDTCTFNT
jgi:hypothetical protein